MPSSRISPGGTAITARPLGVGSWPVSTATSGTDTTPVAGTVYFGSVATHGDMFISGVRFLAGSASTNGNVIASIYDEAGVLLANSLLAGTTTTTAAQTQTVSLTVPYMITGPRYVFVGLSFSSTSDRFRSVPTFCDVGFGIISGSVTGAFGTLASPIAIPTTFTGGVCPIVSFVQV